MVAQGHGWRKKRAQQPGRRRRVAVVGGSGVIVRWDAAATLLDGDPYRNHGVHVIHLRNRTIVSIDVSEDSQAVASCLERQAKASIAEALAARS